MARNTKKGLKEGQRWGRRKGESSVPFPAGVHTRSAGSMCLRSKVQQRVLTKDSGLHPTAGWPWTFHIGLIKGQEVTNMRKILC